MVLAKGETPRNPLSTSGWTKVTGLTYTKMVEKQQGGGTRTQDLEGAKPHLYLARPTTGLLC